MPLPLELSIQSPKPGAEEAGDEFGARYVHVGEIGGVGFVEVVVYFEKGGVGGHLSGREEGMGKDFAMRRRNVIRNVGVVDKYGFQRCWFSRYVGEELVKEADVPGEGERFEIRDQVDEKERCAQ